MPQAYTNAAEVELFINGVSAGRKPVPLYGHVEWPAVTWVPGSLHAVAYGNASKTVPIVSASSLSSSSLPTRRGGLRQPLNRIAPTHCLGAPSAPPLPQAETFRNTTGAASAIRLSIKDGVGGGAGLLAGCQDAALVQVRGVMAGRTLVPAHGLGPHVQPARREGGCSPHVPRLPICLSRFYSHLAACIVRD